MRLKKQVVGSQVFSVTAGASRPHSCVDCACNFSKHIFADFILNGQKVIEFFVELECFKNIAVFSVEKSSDNSDVVFRACNTALKDIVRLFERAGALQILSNRKTRVVSEVIQNGVADPNRQIFLVRVSADI